MRSGEIKEIFALPAGTVYRSDAVPGEKDYLPPELFSAFYGKEAPQLLEKIDSFAVYSSGYTEICEVALFRCRAASDTEFVASLLLHRATLLKKYGGAECLVSTRGRFVLMAATPDADRVIRALLDRI